MEILTQTTHWGLFLFVMAIAIIAALVVVYSTVGGFIEYAQSREQIDLWLSVLLGVVFVFFVGLTVILIRQGPDVTYKAKITDFNTVYKKGYEIVDHNGKLYEIRKEAK